MMKEGGMGIRAVATQLRTTNLEASIDYYVNRLGFDLEFRFQDFYAGLKTIDGHQIHLKLVDEPNPDIEFVQAGTHLHLYFEVDDLDALAVRFRAKGVRFHRDPAETNRGTREFYVLDDQGHVLCFTQDQGNGR
jgi:catechol 2,3-dioxygenase-like lactoylglutathione lyase family enzyme